MSNPQHLRYTRDHEWLTETADGVATVGITAHASSALGDVVYAQLPEVGASVSAGSPCGELESTKAISDIYAPVSGEVTEVNQAVADDPELVNSSPFEDGWLFKVRIDPGAEPGELLTAEEYDAFTEQ
ncbi:glycine cleavage system H protein [Streptomyces zhaozhouensis]|uniref:Glycine cleavage system H protein n=1 Tax=Streptomyces zhaozhouensis TaxID=1300267 RepID=A0A286E3V6_9ACTN|nr:glycine cleavage system protein GcvH [Streptomyces zhaozhouensis]SOD65551.1 glycine cleavage system H protein [Streptomyces zhaozhouensis]